MLAGREGWLRHSGLFDKPTLRPLEGVFSPEVLALSRACPITSGHLRQYERGDMSVTDTLNTIVLAQAAHNTHLTNEVIRAYSQGMRPRVVTLPTTQATQETDHG